MLREGNVRCKGGEARDVRLCNRVADALVVIPDYGPYTLALRLLL